MQQIMYKTLIDSKLSSLENMCNALMRFQAENARLKPEVMASMNYRNRLEPEYHAAKLKQIDVAYSDGRAIGFSFATVSKITEEALNFKPSWAIELSGLGFYPSDYSVPRVIGTVKLLYIEPAFRGLNIGEHLTSRSLEWIDKNMDAGDRWVYVANGNERVGRFYEKFGFEHSHSVFNDFIQAYVLKR